MLAVRNFSFTSHLYFFQHIQLSLFIFICLFILISFLTRFLSSCLHLIVGNRYFSKFINESFDNMHFLIMFINTVCFFFFIFFLLKLEWPKNNVHLADKSPFETGNRIMQPNFQLKFFFLRYGLYPKECQIRKYPSCKKQQCSHV